MPTCNIVIRWGECDTAPTYHTHSVIATMYHLTDERRWNIINVWKNTSNVSLVARELGCTRKCARRWIARYKETSGVQRRHSSGRRPSLSEGAARAALEMLTDGKQATASVVAKELKIKGYTPTVVDKNTLIRHARVAAAKSGQCLRVARGKPKKGLTQHTLSKRLAFAECNQKRDWRRVMFTDRKKYMFRWPGSKVAPCRWELKGGQSDAHQGPYQPSHPQALNIYAGITMFGVTHVHIVAGTSKHKHAHKNKKGEPAKNITSGEYTNVLLKTLLPGGQRLFGIPGVTSWVSVATGWGPYTLSCSCCGKWKVE